MKTPSINLKSESKNSALDYKECTTTCTRCQGLLVNVRFMDMLEIDSLWGSGWRCVNCGSIVDSVIQANRRLAHPPQISRRGSRRRVRRLIAA